MAKIADLTASDFLNAEQVTDGQLVKLARFENLETYDKASDSSIDKDCAIFVESNGSELKPMILNKTNAKALGEMGIVDTDDPIADDFPTLMLIIVDTGQFGQGVRIKVAPDGFAEQF